MPDSNSHVRIIGYFFYLMYINNINLANFTYFLLLNQQFLKKRCKYKQ